MSEDEVGSVAEEAAKLLAALQEWARGAGADAPDSGSIASRLREINDHIGHGPDCRYCPVCQAINFVRDTSPEAREKVVTAAATLMTSVTELLAGLLGTAEPGADQKPGVERIDLTDEEWDES